MPQYRDEGIVLRTQRLGEADRIVTVLTRNSGRVRAVAKGVRKTTSRFGARVEPFGHIDAHFHIGKSLDILSQVESFYSYGATLSQDYAKWTAGQAMLETAERLTPEEKELVGIIESRNFTPDNLKRLYKASARTTLYEDWMFTAITYINSKLNGGDTAENVLEKLKSCL